MGFLQVGIVASRISPTKLWYVQRQKSDCRYQLSALGFGENQTIPYGDETSTPENKLSKNVRVNSRNLNTCYLSKWVTNQHG